MAAAARKELDLATAKRITKMARDLGLENADDPIFEWKLTIPDVKIFQSKTHSNDSFVINNYYLPGQLKLIYSTKDNAYKMSLILTNSELGEMIYSLEPLHFYFCKMTALCGRAMGKMGEGYRFSLKVLDFNAADNEFNFMFNIHDTVTNLTVELFRQPLAMIEYLKPHEDCVAGMIEKFKDDERSLSIRKLLSRASKK